MNFGRTGITKTRTKSF